MKRIAPLVLAAASAVVVAVLFAAPARTPNPVIRGRPLDRWVFDLTNPDYRVREEAVEAIRAAGEEAVPQLARALRKKEFPFRRVALAVHRRFPQFDVDTTDVARVREAAAATLSRLGAAGRKAIPALIAALGDADDRVSVEVERCLRLLAPESVPALIDALDRSDARVRVAAIRVLRDCGGGKAFAPLAARLADRDAAVRCQAAGALGALGADRESTGDALAPALRDPVADVRAAAAESLGEIGPAAHRALPALRETLNDSAAIVRVQAAGAIWRIGRDARRALPALIDALRDRATGWQAAFILGEIGAPARDAVPALVEWMRRERVPRPLRTPPSAVIALGRIGAAAVPELIRALGDDHPEVRTSAVIALGRIGGDAKAAIPDLFQRLRDGDSEVRSASALSLGAIDPSNRNLVPVLQVLAREDDIFISGAALSALWKIDPAIASGLTPE
jgi:HEAT repeat protein